MNRSIILILGILALWNIAFAQNVVVEETFDGNEMGWTENTKPSLGECIIIDGKFKFDSKDNSSFNIYNPYKSTPDLLIAEGVMPVNAQNGFSISVDMEFEHSKDDHLGVTNGILLQYDDDFNFIAVAVSEKTCYILIYEGGKLVRYKYAAVKMKNVNKKTVLANLKVEYRDYKLKVFVDDIEMTEMRKVNIESSNVALFVAGERKVQFDNVIVTQ